MCGRCEEAVLTTKITTPNTRVDTLELDKLDEFIRQEESVRGYNYGSAGASDNLQQHVSSPNVEKQKCLNVEMMNYQRKFFKKY